MDINRIITEEIDRLITEKVYGGQSDTQRTANDRNLYKNFLKLTKGRRGNFDSAYDKKNNPTVSKADSNIIQNKLKPDEINVAAVARKVYPNLTPQGAQSKLQKKIDGKKTDSGNTYKFKEKEVRKIDKVLNDMGM